MAIAVKQESVQPADGISNETSEKIFKPKTSPYLSDAVTLSIGYEEYEEYRVHRHLAQQSPVLQQALELPSLEGPIIRLNGIDKTVGHTFVHYLYTGTYETLMHEEYGIPEEHAEYRKSVLTYRAAKEYQLPGLEDLARVRMDEYDSCVPINVILDVGRDVYRRLGDDDDEWYSDYLRANIHGAFEKDEDLFSQEYFTQGLGEVPRFDKFLVSTMVQVLSERISVLQHHSDVDPSDKINGHPTEDVALSTSPAPELPPSPSGTLSDQYAPVSPRETSPEPEQAEVAEVDEELYDGLEPIPEAVEDYGVERYDGYQDIAQARMYK
ncbi:hypothetical protein CPC735_031830 [Paecilomyces variotii No. 5]|uniref:BTB domain-containing protein n=1 Tax=Byssochlamys spectabilis (strain No. 5 / NBRC 109023) TaxID=1356009 RepID=V5FXW9_BYSSN|nr:hypothetical protein CPC735_031830 [Paecilomyces variotii No. 5]